MGLLIQISPGSAEPVYAQIISQVARAVATGRLAAGDKLPSVRQLAAELVLNPNTVARAYRQMEQQGMVTSKTGAGTFIADPSLRDHDAAQINAVSERMETIIAQGLTLGLTPAELTEMFAGRLKQIDGDASGRR